MQKLIDKISAESYLRNAWNKLHKSNPESHGMSGVSITKFKENLEENIASISHRLSKNVFKFSPNRAVTIKKSNGKFRPLQIPEIHDRIVLKAIALELEVIFEELIAQSRNVSFAYQKSYGVRDAIERMANLYAQGFNVVLEADIVNFFGEVDKENLLNNAIFPKLIDSSLNDLIASGLNQPIVGLAELPKEEAKVFENIGTGIPQGNPLSPLLSNIFLSPFDQYMLSEDYKMIRYADDFIVLLKDEKAASRCFEKASNYLRDKLNLSVYDLGSEKSKIVFPENERFVFLSVEYDGENYFPSIESFDRLKSKIWGVCNLDSDSTNLIELFTKVKNRLEGWLSAFYYTDIGRYLEELDFFIDRQIFLAVRKFEWKLSAKSVATLPKKYTQAGESSDCLSNNQRKASGIPHSIDVFKRLQKENTQNFTQQRADLKSKHNSP